MGRPSIIEGAMLLRLEDAQEDAAWLSQHDSVINAPSLFNTHYVGKTARSQHFHVSQGNDVGIQVHAAVLVELLGPYKVGLVLDLENLSTREGVV